MKSTAVKSAFLTQCYRRMAGGPVLGLCMVLVTALAPAFGGGANAHAASLAPQHEIHRLIMASEKALSEERWDDLSRHLSQLQTLEAKKPAEYFYFRGQAMLHGDQLNEAQSALERYISGAGSDGKHYEQALQLITRIEEQRREAPPRASSEPVAVIEPAQRMDIGALQELYLEANPRQALVAHLNSLLSLNAWQPGPVLRDNPARSIEYQVSTEEGGELQLHETTQEPDQGPVMRTQTVSVFGINPFVSHACFETSQSCWVYDPRDGSRWLRLANRPESATEIAQVLSELIRNLQQGGS